MFYTRYLPRDIIDWLVGSLGILIACLLFGLAMGPLYLIGWNPMLGWFVIMALAVTIALSGLECVTLGPFAVELRRFSRNTVTIPWDQIVRIRPATRWEATLWTLIRPHFASTGCSSNREQACIEWEGGRAFFAPRNLKLFLESAHDQLQQGNIKAS